MTFFCEKYPQTWLFLGDKWPKSGSKFEKMAQKNLIGENGGERKINPSANPAVKLVKSRTIVYRRYESLVFDTYHFAILADVAVKMQF